MFEQIIATLVAAGVRFVVIGGVAATLQGSARVTNDIDICYDNAPDNLERLAACLTRWHAYLRGVERGLPFVLDVKAFMVTPVMTLITDVGAIDLLDRVPGVGMFQDLVRQSELFEIRGVEFRSLTLEALIASKRATGRPRDREHLLELEAIRALKRRDTRS